jgi:hypothetical protein
VGVGCDVEVELGGGAAVSETAAVLVGTDGSVGTAVELTMQAAKVHPTARAKTTFLLISRSQEYRLNRRAD